MARDSRPLEGAGPEPLDDYCLSSVIRSVPSLVAEWRNSPDRPRFQVQAAGLRSADTRTLILRLETTTDPLLLWAAHLELDRRGVPPALRWPGNQDSEQALFITWLGDMLWLAKRHPGHRPRFRGWHGLFFHAPASAGWHAAAHRQFVFVAPRYSLSHHCSKGLNLSDAQRALLMTLPTNRMHADRRAFAGEAFTELNRVLLDHALGRPDNARRRPPHEIASRRARMWRTFVLCGRNQTLATAQWAALTGESMTRQAFAKQIGAAAEAVRLASRGLL